MAGVQKQKCFLDPTNVGQRFSFFHHFHFSFAGFGGSFRNLRFLDGNPDEACKDGS